MFPEILDRAIQFAFLEKAGLSDQALSGTKPAIDRTLVGDHQQHAVGVSMNQVRHRTHQILLRADHSPRPHPPFRQGRERPASRWHRLVALIVAMTVGVIRMG